jgi:uncharacterized protein YqgV (UPF0045/DUF77 family)
VDTLYHIDFLVISGKGNRSINTVVQKIESKNTDSNLRMDRTKMETYREGNKDIKTYEGASAI